MGEIVNRFFVNLYIMKILGRLFKQMCKNCTFMCGIFDAIVYCKFAIYILCKY